MSKQKSEKDTSGKQDNANLPHENAKADLAARIAELRETAEAAALLAEDEESFARAVTAIRAKDGVAYQAELAKRGLLGYCRLICWFFCTRQNVCVCTIFCKRFTKPEPDFSIAQARRFAEISARLAKDEELLKEFIRIFDTEDSAAFEELVERLQLEAFCYEICYWFGILHCRHICVELCPPLPSITTVGNIPTSQITASGTGVGLGQGPGVLGLATLAAGGDHPFGGTTEIRGSLSIASPTQYKLEYALATAGPWLPIIEPIKDLVIIGGVIHSYTRVPDASGWYQVSDMGLLGQDYLTNWNTPGDRNQTYYLRLTVQNAATTNFVSSAIPVRIDNGQPTKPIISLALQAPDGTSQPLGCCSKVEQGAGNLVVITITASDENFNAIGVMLQGGCGVTQAIVDVNSVPLSKTYGGDLTDTGYPAATSFLWNPWAAGVSPCCYLITVNIDDRAITNSQWTGGNDNSNFQAISIA